MKLVILIIFSILFSCASKAESIDWKICNDEKCVKDNGSDIFKEFHPNKDQNIYYEAIVRNIDCNPDNCWVFLGRVNDSVQVSVNGERIFSTLDEHEKKIYTSYDQLIFKIPNHLVQKDGLVFHIEVYDLNEYRYSIDTAHFLISNYKDIRFRQLLRWVATTGVVLFSAFFQLLFILLSLFFGIYFRERKAFFLTFYALVAALYLLSLSEIPRAFLNPIFASGPLHFSLRLLYDLSFLFLIKAYLGKIRISPVVYAIYIAIPCLMFLSWGVGFRSFSHYQSMMFLAATLVLLPPLYGLISTNKHEFLEKKQKMISLLFFSLIFILTANDLLYFWQVLKTGFSVGYFTPLVTLYFVIYSMLKYQKILIEQESKKNIFDIALQVSHDIRSPLAALKMAISQLENISEDSRLILRGSVARINDIANNLYLENKNQIFNKKLEANLSKNSIELIGPVVDYLVSEKQLILQNQHASIKLEVELNHCYGLFCEINSFEFKRVLSNLINNSIESFNGNGKIIIRVVNTILDNQDFVLITIQDNGKGIPQEIVSQVGEKGFSFGKTGSESGTGLGLSHAFSTIQSYHGKIAIDSNVGFGTTIKIYLPKKEAPPWFVKSLGIDSDFDVLVLDDDESIHRLWLERFKALGFTRVKSFFNVNEFKKTVNFEKENNGKIVCLIDYMLSQGKENGLEIIQNLAISHQSIIVTSYFEEDEVIAKITENNLKLIPKTMAGFIPIQLSSEISKDFFEMLYIEDDDLLALTWESKAKRKNIKFKRIKCCEEFETIEHLVDPQNTDIYLDNEFGSNKIKGEDFALILHQRGFQKISISSGHGASYFNNYSWLKIVDKKFPGSQDF